MFVIGTVSVISVIYMAFMVVYVICINELLPVILIVHLPSGERGGALFILMHY